MTFSIHDQNNTMLRIQHQRRVADKVLAALSRLNPSSILAGGAARNWLSGFAANDLDFYIHYNLVSSYAVVVDRMICQELPGILQNAAQHGDNIPGHYRHNPALKTVLNYELEDEIVQVMILDEPTYDLLRVHFPVGSSKFSYYQGAFGPLCPEALLFRDHKIQIVKDVYYDTIRSNPYMRKVMDQFPESAGYVYVKESFYRDVLTRRRLTSWERIDIPGVLREEAAPLPLEEGMSEFDVDSWTVREISFGNLFPNEEDLPL